MLEVAVPISTNVKMVIPFWSNLRASCGDTHIFFVVPCLILLFIWRARNAKKHQGAPFEPLLVIDKINSYLLNIASFAKPSFWKGYFKLCRKFNILVKDPAPERPIMVTWQAPGQGWVKLKTDGSWQENLAGGGGVIRDHNGEVLLSFQTFFQATNSFVSEIKALEFGVQLLSSNFPHLRWWTELDNAGVVKLVQTGKQGHWAFMHAAM